MLPEDAEAGSGTQALSGVEASGFFHGLRKVCSHQSHWSDLPDAGSPAGPALPAAKASDGETSRLSN